MNKICTSILNNWNSFISRKCKNKENELKLLRKITLSKVVIMITINIYREQISHLLQCE